MSSQNNLKYFLANGNIHAQKKEKARLWVVNHSIFVPFLTSTQCILTCLVAVKLKSVARATLFSEWHIDMCFHNAESHLDCL